MHILRPSDVSQYDRTLGAAILNLSKNGQIGTLERHTHLFSTICGNSRQYFIGVLL